MVTGAPLPGPEIFNAEAKGFNQRSNGGLGQFFWLGVPQ